MESTRINSKKDPIATKPFKEKIETGYRKEMGNHF